MKKYLLCATALVAAGAAHAQVGTGRQLDVIGAPTGTVNLPSIGGVEVLEQPVFGIFWDERCSSVEYTFNSNQGANVGLPDEIDAQTLADEVQAGLDRWNDNPSSFIEMNVTNVTDLGNRPIIQGDFINEVTFITAAGFGALASSPSFSLTADTTFVAGADLDGDGDSDVFDPEAEGINVCRDVDGDGDIEFPAGDYAAGTILDNDVQFSSTVDWELGATNTEGADVDAVSTHEFGHSHGLNHAFINQISLANGTGSTMFPFIDTTDSDSELESRTPHVDDLAASAFIYPEGSGESGPSALQDGDVAFLDAFDVIRGEINGISLNAGADGMTPTRLPILGANIQATTRRGLRETLTETYSGTSIVFGELTDLNGDGDTTDLFVFDESAADGEYALPVPSRNVYTVEIQALDGSPAAAGNISLNAIIGDILGQTSFPEEGQSRRRESNIEVLPQLSVPFFSGSPVAQNLDFETNDETALANWEVVDFVGTGAIGGAATVTYLEVIDGASVVAELADGGIPLAATFRTGTVDASRIPMYTSAQIAVGRLDEGGLPVVEQVLRTENNFVGQDGDFTRMSVVNPRGLRFQLAGILANDPDLDVFLILNADGTDVGPSGFAPIFLGLDVTTPNTETSFISLDGAPFTLRPNIWTVELRFVNDGTPAPQAVLPQ